MNKPLPKKRASKKRPTNKSGPVKVVKESKYSELDTLLGELAEARAQQSTLSEGISVIQSRVLDLMDELEVKSRTIKDDKGVKVLAATRQQNTSMVFDQPRLKKKLGAKLWDKVTVKSLDKRLLDACLANGTIKADLIADCATEKVSSPFVKITK